MKKKVFSLMMTLLLAFMGVARADELTVNDGTTTNGNVPVYGFYADAYLKCEFVQPAADLADMNGATINGVTFYASQSSVSWGAANFEVFLTEVDNTTLSTFVGDGTIVYQGALSIVDGMMNVTFTEPYTYNGGNLLIGVYNLAEGTYVTSTWYGVSATGASVQGYSYSDLASVSASQRNFLPKMTFDYTPGGGEGGEEVVVEIGDGTSTTYYCPFNSLWGYSFVEQVYTADEIGTAGTINSISFNMSSTDAQTNAIDVFMKNVSRSNFSGNTDWETVTASDMVFSGTVTFTNGWTTITLDTPFQYDGTSNLMIGMHEYTSGYSTRYFYYTTVTGGMISGHNDSADPNPYDMGSYTGSTYTQNYRANIQIDITTAGGSGLEPITEVYINDYVAPVWGEPVTQNVTIPEDANYTLMAAAWFTYPTGYLPTREMNPDPIYNLDDMDYVWGFILLPNEGYEFPANFTAYINGSSDLVLMAVVVTPEAHEEEPELPVGAAVIYTYAYYTYEEGLHTLSTYAGQESIDRLLIERPNGAWMEPYHFNLYNDGDEDVEVVLIDFLFNNGYFSMAEGTEYPFTVAADGRPGVDLYINTNIDWTSTDEINSKLAVNTNERSTHLYQIVAAPYQPYCPDVVETAYNLNNGNALNAGFTWRKHMSEIWNGPAEMELHANYDLPDFEENIPDGYDAVMKFTIDHPMNLNARVVEGYENGKVALYRADFDGEAGPMATNNYVGRPMAGGGSTPAGGGFEAQIGEGTSTTGYMPFYVLYNYSIAEALYLADELSGTGVTTAPMTSLSWYATNNSDEDQTGITIWMANTDATTAPATSPLASGMTKVYTGMLPANSPTGWTEFVFNAGSFAWDGHSNIMILVQRNCGDWDGSIQWQAHNPGFQAMGYLYTDNAPYNVETSTYTLTTSSTSRPNIIMKGGNRGNRDEFVYGFENGLEGWTPMDVNAGEGTWLHSSANLGGYDYTDLAHTGTGFAMCYSYVDYDGAYDTDSYLVSPQNYSVTNGATLSFYADNANDSYPENFSVCVATVANPTASDFTQVWGGSAKGSTREGANVRHMANRYENWRYHTVDLSAYAGQEIWIAFHDVNYDMYEVWIDDVTISGVSTGSVEPVPTVPVTFNMEDSYGDGWNGASITITTDGGFSQTVTLGSGSEGTQIVNIPAGSQVTLTWNTGSYDYECSCDVVMDGVVIYSFDNPSAGESYTFDTPASDTPVDPTPVDPDQPVEITFHDWSAGPVITDLNVVAGTYYLVASSTDADYEVEFGMTELPCPEKALVVSPVDNAMGLDPDGIVLRWVLSPDCIQYRLVFGSTYWPDDEPEHPQTIITEWSSDLAESYALPALWNNTNYFWRIDQRTGLSDENPGCVTTGDVWGFTTHLNVPQNLRANDETIFEDEPLTLTWNPIQDRTYRRYYIYKDGEYYDQTALTPDPTAHVSYTFPEGSLTYNMEGYNFYVTAVYDEGESAPSNEVNVKVSGYSNATGINGYAYEQDGTTGIAGVTVTLTGTDEFGDPHTYTTTTGANGYYHQVVYAGDYTMAIANKPGYQETVTNHTLPFTVAYNGQVNNVNFIMDENFVAPAHVCAQTVYAPGVTGDTLVQVYWDFNFCAGDYEAQIGNGTTTTGYFPFYTLYNNSLATALYKADEMIEAGVTTAPMNSLSWYATNAPGYAQQGITIWMANVTDNTVSTTSPLATGMTKVYTGAMTPAVGWNEFVFNENDFEWDGESNILILVQRLNGEWNSTVSWRASNAGFNAMSYDYDDYEVYNAENQSYSMSTSTTRPNIIMKGSCNREAEALRSLHHFNIYRTDCYNDGPYNSENTDFVSTAWVPDTSYFDVGWPTLAPGVYKYGVSAVYAGNRDDVVEYPFEERESEIVWHTGCGPCLDKDMQMMDVTVNVVLNSADSPEGSVVTFTNMNPGEQANHPIAPVVLDQTGYYEFPSFRRGVYEVLVEHAGYVSETHVIDLWNDDYFVDTFEGNTVTVPGHDLRFVLTEIIYEPINLYVSRTGWAMWAPFIPEGGETPVNPDDPTGGDNSFTEGFEGGLNGWTVLTVNAAGGQWIHSDANLGGYDYTTHAHGGTGFAMCYSFVDYDGAYDTDSYLVSPQQYSIANGSTLTFWADNANDSYPESFSVCVATAANPTASDFTQVWSGSAKGTGAAKADVRHDGTRYDNWRSHSIDLSAYAGQNVWIAFHDVNYDMYEVWIDDVALTAGREDERHLEGYKVLCTSIDGQPIYNTNTVHPFCQLATDELVEGELYICYVASIYSTGMSDYISCTWQYEPCDHYPGTVDGAHVDGNVVSWTYPGSGQGPVDPDDPQPGENVTVVLNTPNDIWGDGSGYQLFLDADATVAAGLPTGNFGGSIPAETVAEFEYSIPANADGYVNTSNVISAAGTSTGSVVIPAGTYDMLVVNPDGSNVWVVGNGGQFTGLNDDFVFEANKTYTFTVVGTTSGDGLNLVVTDGRGNCTTFALTAPAKTARDCRVSANAVATELVAANTAANQTVFDTRDGWLTYDYTGVYYNAIGLTSGGEFSYGNMHPASQMAAYNGQCVSKVSLVPFCDMTGSIDIYQGGTSEPATLVYTQPISLTGVGEAVPYVDVDLTTPVTIDGSQSLWVIITASTYTTYPAAMTSFQGDVNGSWVYLAGSGWMSIGAAGIDGTWMLKTYVEECTTPTPVDPEDPTVDENILGAMIFVDGEWEAFVEAPTNEYVYNGDGQEVCVRIVYNGTAELPSNNYYYAMSCEDCEGGLEPAPDCEAGDPIYAEVIGSTDNVHIWWGTPEEPIVEPVVLFQDDFEDGALSNWYLIDGDSDGDNWQAGTPDAYGIGNAHSGTYCATSWSWNSYSIDPDNWMVSPEVNGATSITYFVATNTGYPDHYGVYASSTGMNVNDFSLVFDETVPVAKGGAALGKASIAEGGNRELSPWTERTIELPAGTKYVAFRHYNSYDMNYLFVDDVTIMGISRDGNRDGLLGYNVYRSTDNVAYDFLTFVEVNDENFYEVFDAPEAGTYFYMVKAVYEDGCESEGAIDGNNPANHYVMVGVTGVGENFAEVNLFPNPTKGNVTIQAQGMHRITVVSILGQVVYDTELDQDEFVLNMAQFNTGMYMVRVYTDGGVTVKRVTVMH